MLRLEKIGDFVWVPMGQVCEIAGLFCTFSFSFQNGPGSCCYRTIWAYDSHALALRNYGGESECTSSSKHSWEDVERMQIRRGRMGSPDYVRAVVEVQTAFDARTTRDADWPYRWRTHYSNGRIGIRLVELPAANQTPASAILDMICGV